mmetsp:Transcript_7618/g.21224  ORF Transcript_7618/g.21224 Transcript_7618/m.21224 type:complete len:172 (-) Transcript_7618:791-1306(-)
MDGRPSAASADAPAAAPKVSGAPKTMDEPPAAAAAEEESAAPVVYSRCRSWTDGAAAERSGLGDTDRGRGNDDDDGGRGGEEAIRMEDLTLLATLRITSSSRGGAPDDELRLWRVVRPPGAEWTLLPEEEEDGRGIGIGIGAVPAALMAAAILRSAMTDAGLAPVPLGLSR